VARCSDGAGGGIAVLTILHVAETGSTNTDMLARARDGQAAEGDWLIADVQTAGRGRMGRQWQSPPGNLYASGLVTLRPADPDAATLAPLTAIAVFETLALWCDPAVLQIKWPNDVLAVPAPSAPRAPGRKLCGILLERAGDAVVVGVGLNLAHHPELPDRPVTSLAALGVSPPDAPAFADAFTGIFAEWLGIWRNAGLDPVRAAWLDRAHPIGTTLTANLPDGDRIEGVFDGLTSECALRLRLADGTIRVIHAGDVFLI
jgi:BirA family transcriptional regulator, biotin operon repressor / biotin---[acetyl-CoA-carboxylase] ligase